MVIKHSYTPANDGHSEGWLIYREPDYRRNLVFAERLVNAAANHGLLLHAVMHEKILHGVKDGRLFASADGRGDIPSFAIQRAMDPFLAGHLEKMGVRLFNRSAISAMCNDKALTYQAVAALGVPMLPTWFTDKASLLAGLDLHDRQDPFPWPAVVKSVGGRGGAEVYLAMDADKLMELAGNTLADGRYVLQPLCGRPGTDIRVFVVGSEPVAAIRRQSASSGIDGFRANYSMGGSAEVHHLDKVELGIVNKIASAFPFDYVGIDFLLDADGQFLFNEMEDAVGSRTLSLCTDIDIADLFLDHVAGTLKK
jgi:gamma-F420-2:alpha-L-glutamate ligase